MVDFFNAIKAVPLVNFLGMPFVQVPRSKTLFCVWQTRSKDLAPIAKKCSTLRGASCFNGALLELWIPGDAGADRNPTALPYPNSVSPEARISMKSAGIVA